MSASWPKNKEWTYLKDSGPLIVYFANEVEKAISSHFGNRMDALMEAGKQLGGYRPQTPFFNNVRLRWIA